MREPPVRRAVLAILLVCGATIFTGLGSTSLWEPDEPRFAAATRQMLATGDYLTPWFNGRPRFEKPIVFYWMQAAPFALLGPTEAAARLPAAVTGTLAVLLLYALGRRTLSDRAALAGALVLATSFRFVIYCRQGLTDIPVCFLEMAALWGFLRGLEEPSRSRGYAALAWGCIGLAVATKGPVAVIPLLVWVPYLALNRQLRSGLARMHVVTGAGLALAIAAPWYLYMIAVHGRAYVDHALGYELVRRYADAEFPGPKRGVLYYFGVWPGDAAPWTIFFLAALVWIGRRWRALDPRERHGLLLAGTWFAVVLLLFSSASGKLPHYLLPLYPPLALIVGFFADHASRPPGREPLEASWRLAVGLTSVLLAAAAALVALFLRGAFGVAPTGLAMLLPILLLTGGVLAAAFEWRRRRKAVVVSLVAVLAAAYALLGMHIAPRYLQDMQPVRALGQAVAAESRPGDRVGHHGSFGGPGLVYYSGHVVESLPTHDAVAEFLSGEGRRFCVLSAGDLEAVQERAHPPLHVLARHSVLNVRFKRVLEGRAADPRRDLLLVSNRPTAIR